MCFKMISESNNPHVKTHAFGMTSLKLLEQYPFTNGALYINKHINLFLRRQNPEGIYDIRSKTYPYDINTNNISFEKENNYYEEDNIEC